MVVIGCMGRDLPGYSKGNTPRSVPFTTAGRFLSLGYGDGKARCQIFPVHGRHFDIGFYQVETQKSNQSAQPDIQCATLLVIALSPGYSWKYLQILRTDGIGVVGIKRKGIDLDKSTKPCKETEQTVCGSHRICLLAGKAAERFSSPTLTNLRRFGNTKKPSFRI